MDCAIQIAPNATNTITGLNHLEGEAVSVVIDRNLSVGGIGGTVLASPNNPAYTTATVASGAITVTGLSAANGIVVGLPITSDVETLDIDAANRTVKDSTFNITTVGVTFEDTQGMYAGPRAPTTTNGLVDTTGNYRLQPVVVRDEDDNTLLAPTTGYRAVNVESRFTGGGRIFLRQVDPLPMTVTAISPQGNFPRG